MARNPYLVLGGKSGSRVVLGFFCLACLVSLFFAFGSEALGSSLMQVYDIGLAWDSIWGIGALNTLQVSLLREAC